ncbi:mycofactocin-coupled SDR family oxidoreductase [Leptolyngbya sp. FACHB-541]|uniref:mycofactocin-coupled SDR family oxidoreductase n=1 Tax=Leptolyngbya sp. FACHB-541 TaxID=2692810 RepID=UPI00168881D6|nr:mycofactocin-coupled SDR family oxidoreductase [Leptolyngbya sp. FACHB-541]MBD2000256.1 mycofactocin-coupled SDR family oxidoreductase [Leptolyngbya sp. FACHB-541]
MTRRKLILGSSVLAGTVVVSNTKLNQASAQPSQASTVAIEPAISRQGRLQGQVAIVTGAARGIGRACAVALAREGADVVTLDIAQQISSVKYPMSRMEDLAETDQQIKALGRRSLVIQADVRNSDQMQAAVDRTIRELGKVDIMVPNAGICTYVPSLDQMSEAEWDDVIDVNLSGVARSMRAVIPHMRERKQGRIIVVNSCNSRFGSPGSPSYNASKWGVLGLIKCVATEVAKDNITVNAVNPTGVRTLMTQNDEARRWANPQNPTQENLENALLSFNSQSRSFLEPEEIANALLFFAMPEAAMITGEAIDVAAGANVRWNS